MACVNRQLKTILCDAIAHFKAHSSAAESKMVFLLLKEGKSKSFYPLKYRRATVNFPFFPDNRYLPFPDFLESYIWQKAVRGGAGQDPCAAPVWTLSPTHRAKPACVSRVNR